VPEVVDLRPRPAPAASPPTCPGAARGERPPAWAMANGRKSRSPGHDALTAFRVAQRQRQPQAHHQAERGPGQHRAQRDGRSTAARFALSPAAGRRPKPGPPPRRPRPQREPRLRPGRTHSPVRADADLQLLLRSALTSGPGRAVTRSTTRGGHTWPSKQRHSSLLFPSYESVDPPSLPLSLYLGALRCP
jgi:hypothetical protein